MCYVQCFRIGTWSPNKHTDTSTQTFIFCSSKIRILYDVMVIRVHHQAPRRTTSDTQTQTQAQQYYMYCVSMETDPWQMQHFIGSLPVWKIGILEVQSQSRVIERERGGGERKKARWRDWERERDLRTIWNGNASCSAMAAYQRFRFRWTVRRRTWVCVSAQQGCVCVFLNTMKEEDFFLLF